MNNYDVVIVGAGPSGLFAAERLSHEDLSVLVIDKKRFAGGAGAQTDGKIIFHPRVGIEQDELPLTPEEFDRYTSIIEQKFLDCGVDPEKISDANSPEGIALAREASKYNLELVLSKTRHMGTDRAPRIMQNFKESLEQRGIEFLMDTGVKGVQKEGEIFTTTLENGTKINSPYVLVGPGRGHSQWWRNQAEKLGAEYKHGKIHLGARVEVPKSTFDPITNISYDAKFYFKSLSHNDTVRTFCVNPGGRVALESPKDSVKIDGQLYQLVNGHSRSDNATANTNLAILVSLPLTEPETDSKEYINRVIVNTYANGGGKPIAQRWGDLKRGSRSKTGTFNDPMRGYNRLEPSLNPRLFTPGDLSLAYPGRFASGISEMIEQLDHIAPGFGHPSTILYLPEAKFVDTVYKSKGNSMETTIDNLFVMGDGAGKSRGIVGAGLTGILAAEGVINKR